MFKTTTRIILTSAHDIKRWFDQLDISEAKRHGKHKIKFVRSEIMKEIQKTTTGRKVFVLPSQLNSAEYPNEKKIVKSVDDYYGDNTGGPRGQLACDPGVAQFILNNALSNENPNGVLDNTKHVLGKVLSLKVQNGYLLAKQEVTDIDVDEFKNSLHKMTVLASQDISTNGLIPTKAKFNTDIRKVDLLYASAMPSGKSDYVNKTLANSTQHKQIEKLVLLSQYSACFRYACARSPCTLYLMPLGGGVFLNVFEDIFDAMCLSLESVMKTQLEEAMKNVDIRILTWETSDTEANECIKYGFKEINES
jgi:hypothetical protein